MRFTLVSLAVLVSASPTLAADIAATSRIDAVLVFPSGAEVTRLAKVRIDAGQHTVILSDLPAQAVPGSIRVEGKANGRLEIGSVDSRRLAVPRADAANAASERRRIEEEIERLKDQRAVLQADVQAAETQKALIANLAQLPLRPPAAGQSGAREDWGQLVGLIGTGFGDAQRRLLEAQVKLRTVDRQIQDLERKLASIAPGQEERTEVKVFVGAGAALDADLIVRYQVSNASWMPLYDARLSTGTRATPAKLTLTRRASVSQRTGEPWENVALTLSSARPAAGSAAPRLRTLTVDFEAERPPSPPAAPVAGAARPDTKEGLKARRMDTDKVASDERLAQPREDVVERRAGIDTTGFQVTFTPPGRTTIPNTGEAKRLQLDEDVMEPALVVRTVPKMEAKAFLYAKITMPRKSPYLPGPVALFRDQTFVGTGRLPQLTPGEEHELGFGADDAVRVRYVVVEEKRSESGIISSLRTDQRFYRVTIKNTHERPIAFTMIDQVPVSLNQDIKVEPTGRTPPSRRDFEDQRGVLAWDDKLGPDEEKAIEFGYRLSWPAAKSITYGR